MKKFISVLLSVLMLVPCFSLVCIAEEKAPEYYLGDINKDSKFNLVDVAYLIKYLAKWDLPGISITLDNADVNYDGKIHLVDVLIMMQNLVTYARMA